MPLFFLCLKYKMPLSRQSTKKKVRFNKSRSLRKKSNGHRGGSRRDANTYSMEQLDRDVDDFINRLRNAISSRLRRERSSSSSSSNSRSRSRSRSPRRSRSGMRSVLSHLEDLEEERGYFRPGILDTRRMGSDEKLTYFLDLIENSNRRLGKGVMASVQDPIIKIIKGTKDLKKKLKELGVLARKTGLIDKEVF